MNLFVQDNTFLEPVADVSVSSTTSLQAPIVKTSEEILKDTPTISGRALPETNPLINRKGAYQPIQFRAMNS